MQGKIVKGIAGFYYVHVVESGVYECKAKGIFRKERMKPLVGDNVEIEILDRDAREGNITDILPRKSELIRPAVSNIDQALVADAFVIGSPVYFASPAGGAVSFMDRLFFSTLNIDKTMKVGAAVVSCRRGGNTATFDMLNKYFTMCGMPVASSQYWNMVHGGSPEEVLKDEEGMQTMRTLGHNMAFLMKSIQMGKEKLGIPQKEKTIFTSFHH